jgi:hypothetical protein
MSLFELISDNKMKKLFYLIAVLFLITACSKQPKNINKKEMIGKYTVHLELNENTINKQGIKDTVANAMEKAKAELAKAKEEMDVNINLSGIDTSTSEGKMEYYAKSFAKTMANFGKDLGELGILMGEAAGDVSVSAMEMTEGLIKKIKLDVELKENGQIISTSDFANNIKFAGKRWQTTQDTFIVKDEDDNTKYEFKITDQTNDGFVLMQDKYRLIFERKPAE